MISFREYTRFLLQWTFTILLTIQGCFLLREGDVRGRARLAVVAFFLAWHIREVNDAFDGWEMHPLQPDEESDWPDRYERCYWVRRKR